MSRWVAIVAGTALSSLLMIPTGAWADPDELMPCKIALVKAPPAGGGQGLMKFVCKGTFALPSAAAAPTFGGLQVSANTVPPGNSTFAPVPCVGLGSPAGAKGYKCSGGGYLNLIKPNLVKGSWRYDYPSFMYGTPHPFTGDLAIQLQAVGSGDSKNYCARFPLASASRNDPSVFKVKNAPAPADCSPSGAFLDGLQ